MQTAYLRRLLQSQQLLSQVDDDAATAAEIMAYEALRYKKQHCKSSGANEIF
jgi:hypothetical protein